MLASLRPLEPCCLLRPKAQHTPQSAPGFIPSLSTMGSSIIRHGNMAVIERLLPHVLPDLSHKISAAATAVSVGNVDVLESVLKLICAEDIASLHRTSAPWAYFPLSAWLSSPGYSPALRQQLWLLLRPVYFAPISCQQTAQQKKWLASLSHAACARDDLFALDTLFDCGAERNRSLLVSAISQLAPEAVRLVSSHMAQANWARTPASEIASWITGVAKTLDEMYVRFPSNDHQKPWFRRVCATLESLISITKLGTNAPVDRRS
jgi:hypothetical protein